MTDRNGYRAVIGIAIPSLNTTTQPESEALRPAGVTNQSARFLVRDLAINDDADFAAMMSGMLPRIGSAIEQLATCRPDHLLVSLSTETLPDAAGAAATIRSTAADCMDCDVTLTTDACVEALQRMGVKRVQLLSPFTAGAAASASHYFEEAGFSVNGHTALGLASPLDYPNVRPETIHERLQASELDGAEVILQLGTNLSTAAMAAPLERALGRPFISANVASYWHALRSLGIIDPIEGFGRLAELY
ncbi:MAG: hypothetical protein HKO62_00415 [Gammaproteobacteria bacterium]|nr:hypothetical protein [Gammaproteobacteria bacterium]NNL99178.1 hypothetical protein [Gammaproteobacteria bacterium]